MKKYLFIFSALLFSQCHHLPEEESRPMKVNLEKKWETDTLFKTPESVLNDPKSGRLYVSNINGFHPDQKDGDGFISIINASGTIESLQWATGLNDPKGMAIVKNKLYVADITELTEIDVQTGEVIGRIAAPDAAFLNDVTVDKKGKIYVSDTGKNRIYQLKDDSLSIFFEGNEIPSANGLLAEDERLLVGSMGSGEVLSIHYKNRMADAFTSGIQSNDGIAKDAHKNYFVSSWDGEVYYVNKMGNKEKVLDTKASGYNAADIDFSRETSLLFVPTFYKNSVVAYEVRYQ